MGAPPPTLEGPPCGGHVPNRLPPGSQAGSTILSFTAPPLQRKDTFQDFMGMPEEGARTCKGSGGRHAHDREKLKKIPLQKKVAFSIFMGIPGLATQHGKNTEILVLRQILVFFLRGM